MSIENSFACVDTYSLYSLLHTKNVIAPNIGQSYGWVCIEMQVVNMSSYFPTLFYKCSEQMFFFYPIFMVILQLG